MMMDCKCNFPFPNISSSALAVGSSLFCRLRLASLHYFIYFVFFVLIVFDILSGDALWRLIGFLASFRRRSSQYSALEQKQKRRLCAAAETYICAEIYICAYNKGQM